MAGSLTIVTAAAVEPVSVVEAKRHMREDLVSATNDTLIENLLKASRAAIEDLTGRKMITQTWKWIFDNYPSGDTLLLPLAPATVLTHIKTTDQEAAQTTFAATNYITDFGAEPARVTLKSGSTWPSPAASLQEIKGVEAQFVAGYADAAAVPQMLKVAMKELCAHLYENREMYTPGAILKVVPMGVMALIEPYRAWNRFGHAKVDPT